MAEKVIFIAIIITSLLFITAVAFHSVQEVHYLKSFYPEEFTVEEAKDASIVEFVKVSLISLPLILLIIISLVILKNKR